MNPFLFVGSIPPPYHGQAVVTEMVFDIESENLEKECLNLRFSDDLASVGGLNLSKVKTLIYGWLSMLGYRFRHLTKNPGLYYCAGSANWVPLIRDVLLLGTVGKLFSRRVIHYHSGGLPEWFATSKAACLLGKWAYGGAWKALALTEAVDVPCFGNTQKVIVPNGLDVDHIESDTISKASEPAEFVFLFLGALRETKGIDILIQGVKNLVDDNTDDNWVVHCVGEWSSSEERDRWLNYISSHHLEERIHFLGRLTGDAKWQAYAAASVFVFPSYYESENQPLVVIEAMGMGVPVISTRWRGIPELLEDGKTGLLVDPNNVGSLTTAMSKLIDHPDMLESMAVSAQTRYAESFTKAAFQERIITCILNP